MKELVQKTNRPFDLIYEKDEFLQMLKSRYQTAKFYIKKTNEETEAFITEYFSDRTFLLTTAAEYEPEDKIITVHGLTDKYVELEINIAEKISAGKFRCSLNFVRKASNVRKGIRIRPEADEVSAVNFRIPDTELGISDNRVPAAIKVLLEQLKTANMNMADYFTADIFSQKETDLLLKEVKKTGKNVFIKDLSETESYFPVNSNFIDAAKLFGNDLQRNIKIYTDKGYRSMAIIPLIYAPDSSAEKKQVIFGYIRIISKKENLKPDIILDLKEKADLFMQKVTDANTRIFPVHQEIDDISRLGARIKITDPEIKKLIMKTDRFMVDILFKFQAPVTMVADIKSFCTANDGILYAGVDFAGNSEGKEELERFYSMLKPMEDEFKAKLIKSRMQKKQAQA